MTLPLKREQLKRARETLGLTQGEFAEKLDLSVESVRSLEWGRVRPSAKTLIRICQLTQKSAKVLFPDIH